MKKVTIKDLPEEQMAKIKQLVERLQQEKNQKNKYKMLHERLSQEHNQLKTQYEALEKKYEFMRAQLSNSKMAIVKARQVYNASKSAQKRKSYIDQSQDEWQTIEQPTSIIHTSTKQAQSRMTHILEIENKQKMFPPSSHEKASFSSKKLNGSGSQKKIQITNLKKEIEQLTEQMKSKQRTNLPFDEKIKQCEQIRKRYHKQPQRSQDGKKKDPNESSSQKEKKQVSSNNKSPIKKYQFEESTPSEQKIQPKNYTSRQTSIKKAQKKNLKASHLRDAIYDQSFFDIIDQLNNN